MASDQPPSARPQRGSISKEPRPSEKIPRLQNIALGIFVPLQDDDLRQNSEPARDRVERLKRKLRSIDYQRAGVKENLMYMFEREKQRIILEAQEREADMYPDGLPPKGPGLHPREADLAIANMETPATPGTDYNVRNVLAIDVNRPLPPNLSVRERVIEDLVNLVENGATQLNGYEQHIKGIKDYYLGCLEREMAKMDLVGLRPEERRVAMADM